MPDLLTDLRRYGDALERANFTDPIESTTPVPERRRQRWLAPVAAAIAVLVVVGGVWLLARDSDDPGPPSSPPSTKGTPTLSILKRPLTPRDEIPPEASPFLGPAPMPMAPGSLRLAVSARGWDVYLAASIQPDRDGYCITTIEPNDDAGASTPSRTPGGTACSTYEALTDPRGSPTMSSPDPNGTWTVVGVVPDGTTDVTIGGRRAVLGENAFIAHHVDQVASPEVRIVDRDGTRSFRLIPPRRFTPPKG
jgi:hypothetical protein